MRKSQKKSSTTNNERSKSKSNQPTKSEKKKKEDVQDTAGILNEHASSSFNLNNQKSGTSKKSKKSVAAKSGGQLIEGAPSGSGVNIGDTTSQLNPKDGSTVVEDFHANEEDAAVAQLTDIVAAAGEKDDSPQLPGNEEVDAISNAQLQHPQPQQATEDDIDVQMDQVLNEIDQTESGIDNNGQVNAKIDDQEEISPENVEEEQLLDEVTCKDQEEKRTVQEAQGVQIADELKELENNIMDQYDQNTIPNKSHDSDQKSRKSVSAARQHFNQDPQQQNQEGQLVQQNQQQLDDKQSEMLDKIENEAQQMLPQNDVSALVDPPYDDLDKVTKQLDLGVAQDSDIKIPNRGISGDFKIGEIQSEHSQKSVSIDMDKGAQIEQIQFNFNKKSQTIQNQQRDQAYGDNQKLISNQNSKSNASSPNHPTRNHLTEQLKTDLSKRAQTINFKDNTCKYTKDPKNTSNQQHKVAQEDAPNARKDNQSYQSQSRKEQESMKTPPKQSLNKSQVTSEPRSKIAQEVRNEQEFLYNDLNTNIVQEMQFTSNVQGQVSGEKHDVNPQSSLIDSPVEQPQKPYQAYGENLENDFDQPNFHKEKSKDQIDLAFSRTPVEDLLMHQDDFRKNQKFDMDVDIYNLKDNQIEEVELETGGCEDKEIMKFKDFNDFNDDDNESVRALTLKEGVDYNNHKMQNIDDFKIIYPEGFNEEDDLNKDGKIDNVERELKVITIKDKIRSTVDEKIREEYLQKFRKEVDFHHKVAYRYEKAYRLSKKQPLKKKALNMEIIEIISEHGDYIEQDPMALFYCLYFCIYYNNPDLVEFLRTLISKMMNKPQKIDQMLEYIDVNGIERLRTNGEVINTHVYHMAFYQAIDDDLRVVYAQILRQLRAIQLRDKDAIQLLKQRDYDLIKLTFEKLTTKINLNGGQDKKTSIKSLGYKKYNQAYYEEILIDYHMEQRITQNYRERFLTTQEGMYLVLMMYCQNDYVNHFLKMDIDYVTQDEMIELFCICLKNDSFKIGIQIYMRYINQSDISSKILDIIINSFRDSIKFHEIKMFLLIEHIDELKITQLNSVVDNFMEMFNRKDFRLNPMLAQYNTFKYSLLVYRVCWLIEKKRIYSLITKCTLLTDYLHKGMVKYLERQTHISQLYKYLREPIFHLREKKDSLDIILQMNMEFLLKHPIIVEVLNLVHEGKYSVDSSVLSLSQTFQSFFLMEATDLKSITERMLINIKTLGDSGSGKQASLQFNIWKQCIEQRQQDEMLFTVVFGILIIIVGFVIDMQICSVVMNMIETFGNHFLNDKSIFINADPSKIQSFCDTSIGQMTFLMSLISVFNQLILITGLGFFTYLVQKLTITSLKDNVQLSLGLVAIEISIVITSVFNYLLSTSVPTETYVSDKCSSIKEMTDLEKTNVDFVIMIIGNSGTLSFKLIISCLVFMYTLIIITMLQRTQKLGELIMMVGHMMQEFKKFIITFGLLIALFIIVGMQLSKELKQSETSIFQTVLDIFDGFNGRQKFGDFTFPEGQLFITLFVYIFNILLLSFLVAMFINRYKNVWKNLDALRRMNIIKLKNSSSYDNLYSGITITFFPISIILLPFIIPVVIFKSERLNDFILKVQYGFMILMYCILAIVISIPIVPILYAKSVINAGYIMVNNKRQEYKGQNITQFLLTLLLCPLIILLSLIVDLISLPSLLFRDEKTFEFKYQQSLDVLNKVQFSIITMVFHRIFYHNFTQLYAGKSMSQIELMVMHRKVYKIMDNLHDLCCRGTKDYKESLANVQDYNMTKILSRKCSIPDQSGDVKLSRCDFNMMYAIQMDIEIYNYLDMIFREFSNGKLTHENLLKERKKLQEEEMSMATIKNGQKRLSSGIVFLSMNQAPIGMIFQRDNIDVMNNFFINISSRAFTNIEEILENARDNIEIQKNKETLQELEKIKPAWNNEIIDEITDHFDKFEKVIGNNRNEAILKQNEEAYKCAAKNEAIDKHRSIQSNSDCMTKTMKTRGGNDHKMLQRFKSQTTIDEKNDDINNLIDL